MQARGILAEGGDVQVQQPHYTSNIKLKTQEIKVSDRFGNTYNQPGEEGLLQLPAPSRCPDAMSASEREKEGRRRSA